TGYVLRSLGGSTEWQGNIEINSTGGNYAFLSDSGTMTLSGTLTSIATGTFARRGVQFDGDGDIIVSGNIVKGGTAAVKDIFVSKLGAGTLTLSGTNNFSAGASVSAGTLRAAHVSAFGSGTVTVNGGLLDLAGLAIANPLDMSAGSVTNASAYAGTQTVSGAISYAGTVGGTLDVAAGGLLKGAGVTFTGPVSITGTHSPGASPGLQTFTNGLGYTSAATLVWELSANTAAAIDRGIVYDAIDMTTGGSLSIHPSATISLVFNAPLADSTPSTVDWDDAFWGSPQQWKVIDVLAPVTWNEVSFANVLVGNDSTGASLGSKRPGSSFTTAAVGGDLYVVYVPEPSLLAAGAAGLGLMLVVRRRR
ncbi:MAG: autotransporter-associated beta strand repeat-containing protein, partial [Planctomycetaceae bacterium]